ncbi:alpha-galactosidase [Micromonospora mirobrigensis]|uniref:alpha-galactosidase n=1 Tax=Micromonospora mirobrigensis TaxID=262898 RepID=A0A1C4Z3N2_9ACTN|nr:alpha-galactosidase [Micromonospora mirobrigensis]SCF27221.1 alpha-galactosidase [Micromonospora mirobrigensis]
MPLAPDIVHLRRGGVSVVVDLTDGRLPRILHWGADLGALDHEQLADLRSATLPTIGDSAVTYPQPVPVIPQLAEGWLGRPGVTGNRGGRAFAPWFRDAANTTTDDRVESVATDPDSALRIALRLDLSAEGVLSLSAELRNDGTEPYALDGVELALPLPDTAGELLDLSGRWALERVPQRHPLPIGTWLRESRGGKPGLDHSTIFAAGEAGFGFERGAVWTAHLAWSGNQLLAAERTPAGTRHLRAGEILLSGELTLQPGQSYAAPTVHGVWGDGLNEVTHRMHRMLRARPAHPKSARPVLSNTWEAVYFDHDLAKLRRFAERSADLGIERFVLDDGWFTGRRDDTSSLGDWDVDPVVWPDGLDGLADHVHGLGLQFGLWFEPEMVNLDSELARAHPDWIFDGGHGPGLPSRYQHVLDLGNPDAYAHVLGKVSALVDRLGIDYIKWDHNRYLTDAGHSGSGRAGVHEQTLAAYAMMDELRRRHPGLEIESCASGGGRIDLGVLHRTDRVWPSDCNDPHERVDIQRWTGVLVPPELQGTHIGAEDSHTTHRVAPLDFRAATAFWGNLGVELDLTELDDDTFAHVRRWVDAHKQHRSLLHTGRTVRADTGADVRLDGVVAVDGSEAIFGFTVLSRTATWPPARLRFPGLDPERRYRVTEFAPGVPVPAGQRPPWLDAGVRTTGRALHVHGLEAPSLDPDRTVLFRIEAV